MYEQHEICYNNDSVRITWGRFTMATFSSSLFVMADEGLASIQQGLGQLSVHSKPFVHFSEKSSFSFHAGSSSTTTGDHVPRKSAMKSSRRSKFIDNLQQRHIVEPLAEKMYQTVATGALRRVQSWHDLERRNTAANSNTATNLWQDSSAFSPRSIVRRLSTKRNNTTIHSKSPSPTISTSPNVAQLKRCFSQDDLPGILVPLNSPSTPNKRRRNGLAGDQITDLLSFMHWKKGKMEIEYEADDERGLGDDDEESGKWPRPGTPDPRRKSRMDQKSFEMVVE